MPILRDRETADCGAKAWLTSMAAAKARAVLYLMAKAALISMISSSSIEISQLIQFPLDGERMLLLDGWFVRVF